MTYVLWDLDGTLLDSLQDLALATNHALRQYQLPKRTQEEVRQFVGNGVRRLIERAVPEGTPSATLEATFDCFKDYYKAHCRDNTRPYAGIASTLQTLHQQGTRMAIVSNKLQAGVDALHEEWFADTIDVAIGEREGVARKPAPDMLHLALRELGATPTDHIYYIGDSDVDILTAQRAGVPCISALWGFRSREFLLAHGATLLAESPSDVLRIIESCES